MVESGILLFMPVLALRTHLELPLAVSQFQNVRMEKSIIQLIIFVNAPTALQIKVEFVSILNVKLDRHGMAFLAKSSIAHLPHFSPRIGVFTNLRKNVISVTNGVEILVHIVLINAQLELNGINLAVKVQVNVGMDIMMEDLEIANNYLPNVLQASHGMDQDVKALETFVQEAHMLREATVFLLRLAKMVSYGILPT